MQQSARYSFYKKVTLTGITVLAVLFFLLFQMPDQVAVWEGDSPIKTTLNTVVYLVLALLVAATALWSLWRDPSKQDGARCFWMPTLAGITTLLMLVLGYVFVGMWPMGEESAMIVDMHHQYGPMLAHLRDMLLHGGDVLFSFEAGLGVSFLSMFGYYLASPLNLLLVLFPNHLLDVGILVITILKVSLSAVFFACMLQYVYRRRNVAIVAVSAMYALMLYMLAYSWNLMWLDAVALLPLVVMCFERMMRTGKSLAYIVSLAVLLFCNYYIGFMVCVFMVLYFIAYLLRTRRTAEQNANATVRFAVGSALGGGLVMALLIPVFLALSTTSAAGGTLPDMTSNFSLFDLLGRHLYRATPTIRSGNLPNIACGVLAIVSLPLFITNKGISARRRVTYTGLWLLLAFSLVINHWDLLWHGLHAPNDLPYRFSFLYSFVLLLITYETLLHLRDLKARNVAFTAAGLVAYLMLEEKFGSLGYSFDTIYVTLFLVSIYCVVFALTSLRVLRSRMAYAVLLLAVCAELTVGTGHTLVQLNNQEYYTDHDLYVDNLRTEVIDKTVRMAQAIAARDANNTFYRMELLPRRTLVDPALFDYRGLTIFSSSNYYETTRLMSALGYASNGVNSYMYRSFVAPVDSLLGLRYLVFNKLLTANDHLRWLDSYTGTDADTGEEMTYYVYENKDALPLAWLAQNPVKDWQYSYYDPHYTQQSLYSAMTGMSGELYTLAPLSVQPGSGGCTLNPSVSSTYFSLMPGTGTSKITATVEKAGQCYVYVDCRAAQTINTSIISAAGSSNHSVTPYEPFIIDAGILAPGDTVQVSLTASSGCAGNLYVMTLNQDYYQTAISTLKNNGLKIEKFTDSNIEGTINASYSGVMMTSIPYDQGWQVYIDGKPVDSYAISNSLLAFDLPQGAHTVQMRYWPRGLTVGLILSGLSLILVVVLVLWSRRRPQEDITAEADAPTPAPQEEADMAALFSLDISDGEPEAPTPAEVPAEAPADTEAAAVQPAPAPAPSAETVSEPEDDFLNSFYIQDRKGVSEE